MRPGAIRWLAVAATAVAATALATGPASAQTPPGVVEDWRRTVPNHVGVMMDLGPNDTVFALGYGSTIVTRKYSRNGALQWERPYPTPGERALPSWISADPSGNVVVSAYLIRGSNTPTGWVVIKYDRRGNLLWKDAIPASPAKTVRVETDGAGNAYVIGTTPRTDSAGNLSTDTVTIKYAPNGARLWTRAFNGSTYATDVPRSVAVSGDGSRVAVVGESSGAAFTVVYNAQGNELARHVDLDLFEARGVAYGPQNQLYVGAARWTPETSNQMTIIKFGANGNRLWTRSYPDGDLVERLAVDSRGDVIASGVDQATTGYPYLDWLTLKVNADGARLWSRKYDGTQRNDERPFSLALDPSNGIYVTGEAGPAPRGPNLSWLQMTTVKYAPNGTREWALHTDIGRGVSVRIGTDRGIYLQGQGQMLTARYHETGP